MQEPVREMTPEEEPRKQVTPHACKGEHIINFGTGLL